MESPLGTTESERFLDSLDDLFFVFDATGSTQEWNQAAVEVTGYSPEELADMTPADFFVDEHVDRISEAVESVLEEGEETVEADLLTARGEHIPYEFRARHIQTDDHGDLIVGIGRDITERRVVQRERQDILDRMSDAFLAVDSDWQITYTNERAEAILSAATEENIDSFEGRHLWETVPEAVGTTFYDRYQEAMESQESVFFEAEYEPMEMWFDVRVHPSETGLSVYLYDITERKAQRGAIEARQQVLREMYEIISDGGRSFEDQVRALLELGRAELDVAYGSLSKIEGRDYIFEIVAAEDDSIEVGDVVPLSTTNCEIAAETEQTLVLGDIERDAPEETDRTGFTELGISCYIGSPVMVDDEVYGTYCFYDTEAKAGQFSAWEVTLVDLMSRWVSYDLQRQATTAELERQNEKLEEFAGIVSHDLRNPLNSMLGWLDLAEAEGESEYFERCRRAIDRMDILIEDLLTLAQAGERIADLEPVELRGLADRCWSSVSTGEATFEVEVDQTIHADESRLLQLLENLMRNAVEHGGSNVTIKVGDLPNGFYVEDTGPGIPADVREEVFEGGYTTTEHGTGFGLAIVAEIADAHGWTIDLTEGTDGGARFEFTGVSREG